MRVGSHHLGRAAVGQICAVPFGNPGVGLGYHRQAGSCSSNLGKRGLGVGKVVSAVGADRRHAEFGQTLGCNAARDTHHGATGSVETERDGDGKIGCLLRPEHRRFDLLQGAHGLDPENVDTTGVEPPRLLGEPGLSLSLFERPERHDQFTGRAHRTSHHHPSVG